LANELGIDHVALVLDRVCDFACVELPEVGEASPPADAVGTVP
jgi:hypothetical protein